MALYFNCFYAPWWFIVHGCTLTMKYHALNITYQVILIAIHLVAASVEIVRLYLGFVGNLMEKIPELSGFWITSVILQLPITSFLLFHQGIILLPIEQAVDIVQIMFLIFEISSGYGAVKKVAQHQLTKFQHQILTKDDIHGQKEIVGKHL